MSVLLVLYIVVSCANGFKATSHFFFCEVESGWFYIVVFDPFGLEFCAVAIIIKFYM